MKVTKVPSIKGIDSVDWEHYILIWAILNNHAYDDDNLDTTFGYWGIVMFWLIQLFRIHFISRFSDYYFSKQITIY